MNLTDFAITTLKDRYTRPEDTNVEDVYVRSAKAFSDTEEMFQKMEFYMKKQWFQPSTPALSNAPIRTGWGNTFEESFDMEMFTGKKIGLPISCFLNYVPDSREGLGDHYQENIWLASSGGGVGGYWGHIRSDGASTSNGSQSTGSIPFMHVVDSQMLAFNQGRTRRGSYAAYMDISHPEVLEFLQMRKPTGGDPHRKCLNLHHGINIPDEFMQRVVSLLNNGWDYEVDKWPLIDPHSGTVTEVASVSSLWEQVLNLRATTGEPYLHFIDTSNRYLPSPLKAKGLSVHQSNLCSEITLPTNEERTAVCCLSSINIEKYDEWKDDPDFIYWAIRYLDNVIEYFIRAARNIPKAVESARKERSLGLGSLGFHSFLQSKNIPFESAMAASWNRKIYSRIKEDATAATRRLAEERGEPDDLFGTGLRNAHTMAIAPNASTSILANTSPSIEPWKANAYTHRTLSGAHLVKNPHLVRLLQDKGQDIDSVWKSIITSNGSVQHLDFLTSWEKDVYKTAVEIDQMWVIEHATTRQKHIDQAQSVNIFIPEEGVDIKEFSLWHVRAWEQGLKTLYYCRAMPARRAENLATTVARTHLTEGECLSCEG